MTGQDSSDELTRRTLLGSVATLGTATLGGCLTVRPGVDAPGLADSAVFESLTVREPWGAGRVAMKVRLTPAATTERGVRGLAVVDAEGSKFDTATVVSGQTSRTLFVPTSGRSTLSATDYDGQTVAVLRLSVSGRRIP